MKNCVSIVLLVVFCTSLISACAPPEPTAAENEMLAALATIRTGLDTKTSHAEYRKMLVEAKSKLDTLKSAEKGNACFLNAATKTYQFYELCHDARKKRDAAKDEKTRSDMDMTLTFTVGFASVSMAQAKECFEEK